MFVDKAKVIVQAGNGGDGAMSFRHEKYVDRGGPDGGDGGVGGSVIFVASTNQNTLAKFRYQKTLAAEPGECGSKRRRHGKNGDDLRVAVPVGTLIHDQDGNVVADLVSDGQTAIVAQGGKGGFGNAHFVSSVRQSPRVAEKGEKGQIGQLNLELKMIADVGLIGLPNAGKSTLLATISNARPEIANYPFTTLIPNLGVVDIDSKSSLLVADIPGLIAGASEGKGLGDDFLRHVERTAVLVHLIDIYNEDVATAYKTIRQELQAYRVDLTKRPQLVVLNKIDGFDKDIVDDKLADLKKVVPARTKLLAISAKSNQGVDKLLYDSQKIVSKIRAKENVPKEVVPVIKLAEDTTWQVTPTKTGFVVTGQKIERFAERTDFGNPAGVSRLRDIMRKTGIMHELARKGIEPGQKIVIGTKDGPRIEY